MGERQSVIRSFEAFEHFIGFHQDEVN